MTFDEAVKVILENEGGYINDPFDRGGETNFGITKKNYPNLDIKNLTVEKAISLYKRDYWDAGKCEKILPHLRLSFFDSCVNCGYEATVMILQRAADVEVDGILGKNTLAAQVEVSEKEFAFRRVERYTRIIAKNPTQIRFVVGWLRRVFDTM